MLASRGRFSQSHHHQVVCQVGYQGENQGEGHLLRYLTPLCFPLFTRCTHAAYIICLPLVSPSSPAPHTESQLPLLKTINPSPGTQPKRLQMRLARTCQEDSAAELAAFATLPCPGLALQSQSYFLGGASLTNPTCSRVRTLR